jgi:TonB family protein
MVARSKPILRLRHAKLIPDAGKGRRVGRRVSASLTAISACLALAEGALAVSGAARAMFGSDDTPALKLEHAVPPEYPPLARLAHVQGDVSFTVIVDENGEVTDIKLLSGHPLLVKAAMDAVSQWKYMKPATAPMHFELTVRFELPKDTKGVPRQPAVQPRLQSLVPVEATPQIPPLKLLKIVDPVYPQEAKQRRMQGNVVLSVVVEKGGKVTNIETVSGPKELIAPALDAVKQWEYEPPAKAPILATVTMYFSLADDAVTFQTEARGLLEGQDESNYGVPRHISNPPMPVYKPEPRCPSEAGKACNGTLTVWITVDPEGKVTETRVSKSLGPIVDKVALDTVRTWRFHPATEDGKPVTKQVVLEITFRSF